MLTTDHILMLDTVQLDPDLLPLHIPHIGEHALWSEISEEDSKMKIVIEVKVTKNDQRMWNFLHKDILLLVTPWQAGRWRGQQCDRWAT